MTNHPTPPPAAQTREPLLPCPFCGSVLIELAPVRDGAMAICATCGASARAAFHGPHNDTHKRAIAAWNKRATPAERAGDAALVERLRALSKAHGVYDDGEDDNRIVAFFDSKRDRDAALDAWRSGDDAILAALTPSAPGSGTGWNEAIEAADAAVLALVHPNNRHHLMQDLRASNVLAAIRAALGGAEK